LLKIHWEDIIFVIHSFLPKNSPSHVLPVVKCFRYIDFPPWISWLGWTSSACALVSCNTRQLCFGDHVQESLRFNVDIRIDHEGYLTCHGSRRLSYESEE